MKKNYKLLIFGIGIAACTLGAIIAFSTNLYRIDQTPSHRIVLTENGFTPKMLQIKKGDRVTFTTSRNVPFWPASNTHPTHEIYAAFDPKDAIFPQHSWSFTFNKVGTWQFHDHLAPTFTGTITVTDK